VFDQNDMTLFSMNYVVSLAKLLNDIDHQKVAETTREILRARDNGKNIFIVGSGECSTASNQLASLILLKTKSKKKCFKTISLNANSTSLSISADQYGIDCLYSKQLDALASKGDLLIAFSANGHCESIIETVKVAKMKECTVVGISGSGGGLLKAISDISISVDSTEDFDPIVDLQMSIVQIISKYLIEHCLSEGSHHKVSHPNQLNLLEIQ
jgi:D-sedoheptulose 7-phosphate isomerase